MKAEVWFDFDGTLVDSATGIVHSLQEAFTKCGLKSPLILERMVVGPPLPAVIDSLAPRESPETREKIAAEFRSVYDVYGWENTVPFGGFPGVLRELFSQNLVLRILTNKRQRPLERIVQHLGWTGFFTALHGSDESRQPGRVNSKADRAALIHAGTDAKKMFLVGDSLDDLAAAERIGARFFLAGWGYGTARVLAERPDAVVLNHPEDLLVALDHRCTAD